VQEVPLVATTPVAAPGVSVSRAGEPVDIVFGRDVMLGGTLQEGKVSLADSGLVFVGFGIVAPEYDRDDYAGLDVAGKTVVVLVNDPGFATQDPEVFKGNAMTYYGRWTYKFEEAARQGAAGVLVVHEDAAAGYPWQVVVRSWGGTQYGLGGSTAPRCQVEGWISREAAGRLASAAGHDLAQLEEQAASGEGSPVSLGASLSVEVENRSQRSRSRNVLGKVTGRLRPDETILMCAHWDHLGVKPGGGPDPIHNGALDNASGSSGLLELAEAFAAMEPAPERSLLFLWVTAEESGLLGSRWYAEHPVVPLNRTVAGLNMDVLNVYSPMEDMVVVGFGSSELEEMLAQAVSAQSRTLSPEGSPEKGFFYRSDHFSLAKVGVPMLYADGGTVSREFGADWVKEQEEDYLTRRYHQPGDEYDPSWNLEGAVEDLRAYFAVGRRLANGSEWPNWYQGNEFRAIRDASLGR